jgi:hypothetical protein
MSIYKKILNDFEYIWYRRESTYVISAQKYKFNRPISHEYHIYPDGKLCKVETNSSGFVSTLGMLTAGVTNFELIDYDRNNFSYLIIFIILCFNAIFIVFALGIVTFPASVIFCARLIYWHNKKYHFPQNIRNEIVSGLVKRDKYLRNVIV